MTIFFSLLIALFITAVLSFAFSQARTARARQNLRVALGVVGLLVGVVLVTRGLAVAGVPLVAASAGLLIMAMRSVATFGESAGHEPPPNPRRSRMSRKEAAEILGVTTDASIADIQAAFRELMKRVHPDAGGSDALAAKVQEARDVLLGN